jgi:hypothetical protein
MVNLKRLGSNHIIGIHDCFRTSVMDQAKLVTAIKMAYTSLFCSDTLEGSVSNDLPLGGDILGLYWEGVVGPCEASDGPSSKPFTQFPGGILRELKDIKGVPFSKIIEDLGVSYYFDK